MIPVISPHTPSAASTRKAWGVAERSRPCSCSQGAWVLTLISLSLASASLPCAPFPSLGCGDLISSLLGALHEAPFGDAPRVRYRDRAARRGGCSPRPAAVCLLRLLSLSVLFSGDGFQLMFGASTCIQMPRGQAAPGICPRLLSAKRPAVSSQQARKSQGLLQGWDHHALSWPEAARRLAPLRSGVPVRQ